MRAEMLANPFPDVALSDHDKRAVEREAELLLHEALAQYEAHLTDDRGAVSTRVWKPVKTRDGLSIYHERHPVARAGDSPKVHSMLVVGSLEGSVDDLLLGFVNPTAEASAAYTQYAFKGTVLGAATLASVVRPTRKAPDRSVAIKWEAHNARYPLNKVFHTRDFVTAEATGSTINSMGERVAYQLLHSVSIAGAPELRHLKFIRATKSLSFLYRQASPDHVDVFIMGRVDPKGELSVDVAASAADSLAFMVLRTRQFAEIKKRTWWLRSRNGAALHALGSARDVLAASAPAVAGACGVCAKSTSGLLAPLGRTCAACSSRVCASAACGASAKVIYSRDRGGGGGPGRGRRHSSLGAEFSLHRVSLCAHCLAAARHLSAWELAASDAAAVNDSSSDSEDGSGRGLAAARTARAR